LHTNTASASYSHDTKCIEGHQASGVGESGSIGAAGTMGQRE